jgi:hypothetical protein
MTTKERKIYMWYKVQELHGNSFNKSQISRELGIDRATVRKYLGISEKDFHSLISQGRKLPKKLSRYLGYVKGELELHPYLSSAQIEDRLKERYSDLPQVHSKTVYNFVQLVRKQYDIPKPKGDGQRDFEQVPEVAYGKEAQVDFGEYTMKTSEGKPVKVYFFVMVLSRSRYKYVYFQNRPFSTQDTIYAHGLAFDYFQGIPQKIIYDQDSVFIHKENLGDYLLTHDFQAFSQGQPFEVVFCRKADPQSKGKVENVVGYVKKNFLRGRIFHNAVLLNQSGLSWLSRTANAKIHGSTYKVPAAEWETEKVYLHKLKAKITKQQAGMLAYNVRKDNTVAYRGNFYSLPLGTYKGRKTRIFLLEENQQLKLYSMQKHLLAVHVLGVGKGQLIRNTDHTRDKSLPLIKKHQEVLSLLGSDDKADIYLDLLQKGKPRYYYDNLRAIVKGTQNIPAEFIRKTLVFCLENDLYNGAGFCEVARNYHASSQQSAQSSPNLAIAHSSLPEAQPNFNVQTSDIKTYENLIGSWKK